MLLTIDLVPFKMDILQIFEWIDTSKAQIEIVALKYQFIRANFTQDWQSEMGMTHIFL